VQVNQPAPGAVAAPLDAAAASPARTDTNKRWLATFFAGLLLGGLVLLPGFLFLWRAGEFVPVDEIARAQVAHGGRFQSALREDQVAHKFALYRERKADIMLVGSSRIVELREDFFTTSVMNMAGAAQSLHEVDECLETAFAIHPPKLVILGLDFWWFNPHRPDPKTRYPVVDPPPRFSVAALSKPFDWLMHGKVSPGQLVGTITHPRNSFGVTAQLRGNGYEADGHFQYTSWVTNTEPNWDQKFATSAKWISRGDHDDQLSDTRFAWADHVDPERVKTLGAVIAKLRAKNVPVVLLNTPLPGRSLEQMRASGKYGYLDEIPAAVREFGVPYFDFDAPGEIPIDDCEFLDGLHSGQTVALRMLDKMAADPNIAAVVDAEKVRSLIPEYAGLASIPAKEDGPDYRETDFLMLGCTKKTGVAVR
jgi:hypothetical protein